MSTTANDNTSSDVKPPFNAAAAGGRFLDARLTALEGDTVAMLKGAFVEKLNSLVEETVPDTLRTAAYEYAYATSLNRGKLNPADITNLVQSAANDLQSAKDRLMSPFRELDDKIREFDHSAPVKKTFALLRAFNAAARKFFKPEQPKSNRGLNAPDSLPWDEQGRIYMRLEDNSQSPVRALIEEKLSARGFTITDYTAGRALDGRKNEWKIGKILKDEPALLQAYSDDPSRRNQRLMVVLTRDITDLARASFNRGWQSCRTSARSAASRGVAEAKAGVIMAYLVSENDPDIHNPYSRISIKPYDIITSNPNEPEWRQTSSRACTIYAAFNPIGLHHPGFAAAINDFTETTFNQGKTGKFKLREDCESYGELQTRTRLPQDTKKALEYVGAAVKTKPDGTLKVTGKLSLRGFGLCRLPDLGAVDLSECALDLSQNRLLTLEGLPANGTIKSLNVSGNLLVCFAGACPQVTEEFNYRQNPWLMTAYGAPQAATYRYGNDANYKSHNYSSDSYVCPTQKPQAFPSFKRKK